MNLLQPLIPTFSFLYIALATVLLLIMSFSVIYFRFKEQVAYGVPDPKSNLGKMSRVHGNFTEYAPFYLLLLMALEISGTNSLWIHIYGSALIVSRLFHWKGMFAKKTPNPFRATGMMTLFGGLILMSLQLFWIILK